VIDISLYQKQYSGKVYRIVESQEKVATMQLVDTLDEQSLLEDLIEETKPPVSNNGRHYLIQTPFRYPPLKYGSRFGTRHEKSIFYAGETLDAALSESAFYSFYFQSRMTKSFEEPIINHKTSFSVTLKSCVHIDLTKIKEDSIQGKISHKKDYQFTQSLGKVMREQKVESFSYFSARCPEKVNIGVFDIEAISDGPNDYLQWTLKQSESSVLFLCEQAPKLNASFNIDLFLVDGRLPHPSN